MPNTNRYRTAVSVCYICLPMLAALGVLTHKLIAWESVTTFMMATGLTILIAAGVLFACSFVGHKQIEELANSHSAIGIALAMPKRVAFAQFVPLLLTALAIVIGHMK